MNNSIQFDNVDALIYKIVKIERKGEIVIKSPKTAYKTKYVPLFIDNDISLITDIIKGIIANETLVHSSNISNDVNNYLKIGYSENAQPVIKTFIWTHDLELYKSFDDNEIVRISYKNFDKNLVIIHDKSYIHEIHVSELATFFTERGIADIKIFFISEDDYYSLVVQREIEMIKTIDKNISVRLITINKKLGDSIYSYLTTLNMIWNIQTHYTAKLKIVIRLRQLLHDNMYIFNNGLNETDNMKTPFNLLLNTELEIKPCEIPYFKLSDVTAENYKNKRILYVDLFDKAIILKNNTMAYRDMITGSITGYRTANFYKIIPENLLTYNLKPPYYDLNLALFISNHSYGIDVLFNNFKMDNYNIIQIIYEIIYESRQPYDICYIANDVDNYGKYIFEMMTLPKRTKFYLV